METTLEPVFHFAQPQDDDSAFKKSDEFISYFYGVDCFTKSCWVAWRQRLAAGGRDDNDTLGTITVPTAVISGSLDPSSAPDVMRPIADAMKQSQMRLPRLKTLGILAVMKSLHRLLLL